MIASYSVGRACCRRLTCAGCLQAGWNMAHTLRQLGVEASESALTSSCRPSLLLAT